MTVPHPNLRRAGGLAALGAAVALLALLALLVGADSAFADPVTGGGTAGLSHAQDSTEAGKNLGKLIRDLAGPLAFSLAGLTGLGALIKRDVGMALTMVVITVLIGVFVVDGGEQALIGLSETVAQALGG